MNLAQEAYHAWNDVFHRNADITQSLPDLGALPSIEQEAWEAVSLRLHYLLWVDPPPTLWQRILVAFRTPKRPRLAPRM